MIVIYPQLPSRLMQSMSADRGSADMPFDAEIDVHMPEGGRTRHMLDRQERHCGEEVVVFPRCRAHGGWHLPAKGVASLDGREDEILISFSCRRALKALPIVVPTKMGSRFC
jgi:hypothetical protein